MVDKNQNISCFWGGRSGEGGGGGKRGPEETEEKGTREEGRERRDP